MTLDRRGMTQFEAGIWGTAFASSIASWATNPVMTMAPQQAEAAKEKAAQIADMAVIMFRKVQ